MRFGLSLVSMHGLRSPVEAHEAMLEQATVAEASGFDGVFVSEHHPAPGTGGYCLQPVPLLAALAACTRQIWVGTAVLLLPLYLSWRRLAEELLTVQAVSRGRLILGVGAGFDRREFEAHDLPAASRFKRLEEAIGVLRASWEKWVSQIPGIRPPPMWVAGTTPIAIRRAARLGDAWLPADTAPLGRLKEARDIYVRAMRAEGRDATAVERPLMREALVHEEAATARRRLAGPVVSRYRAYWDTGDVQLRAEFPRRDFTYETLEADRFVVGDPEGCVDSIEAVRGALGTTFLILRIPKADLSQAATLEAIRMFGTRVIPRFRSAHWVSGTG